MAITEVAQLAYCVIPTEPGTLEWSSYTFDGAAGYDLVRIFLPDEGIYSTPVAPTSMLKVAQHKISGLPAGTQFAWTLQGQIGGVWSDLASGTHKTLPPTGPAVRTHKIGVFACGNTHTDVQNPVGVGYAWAHANTRDLDLAVHLGDWHYDEDDGTDQNQHLRHLVTQSHDYVPDMGACLANTGGLYYIPSDHEWGQNWNTGGDPATLAFQNMWRALFAQYESPLATEHALCYSKNVGNDIELVWWDFRNYERTNSDDPDVPFDSPERAACGPEQLAWLLGKLNEKHRFTVLFSDPVWLSKIDPVTGEETELDGGKTDAMASYAYTRSLIAAAMEANPHGVLVTGDYHLSLECSPGNNPHGHWQIIGAAGVDAHMIYQGGDYDQVWPSLDLLPDRPAMSQWLELQLDDQIDSITVTSSSWDCLTDPANPVARVTVNLGFDLSGGDQPLVDGGVPVAADGTSPGSLMTGNPGELQYGRMLTGGRSTLRWKQLVGWRDMPGVDLTDQPQPASHGDIPGDVFAQGGTVTYDSFLSGDLEFDDRMAALDALELCTPLDSTERALVVDDGGGPWLRWARTIARAIPADATWRTGPIPVSLQWRCADPRRYSLTQHSAQIGVQPPSGGLAYPLQYDTGLDYGIAGNEAATVTNNGTTATPPTITIHGAITNPIVRCADWSLAFDLDLGPGEVLVVDTAAGTVQVDGVDRLYALTDDSTPPQGCVLAPGDTSLTLAYTGLGSAAKASVTIAWRDAKL